RASPRKTLRSPRGSVLSAACRARATVKCASTAANAWDVNWRSPMPEWDPRILAVADEQPYPLIFVTISGAHLYGFPSPDSDYDLRGAHILPPKNVLGLDVTDETKEFSGVRDGLEIDLVSH